MISRAQMGSQLKGNRMAKKTQKRQAGGLAGMDPTQQAAAPMAGKNAMRQAVEQAAAAVTNRRPSKTPAPLMRQTQKMNSGGRPGRRGDGIIQRGGTKGRMV
jgi:hypothetical protein